MAADVSNSRVLALAAWLTLLSPVIGSGGWLLPGEVRAAAQERTQSSAIHGRVVDAQSGEPIAGAYVRIREVGRNELSHSDGSFHFERLSGGRYTVLAQRIGYGPVEREVRVGAGERVDLTLPLAASAIQIPGVVITGTGRERRVEETYRPTTVLNGSELRRRLGSSVAATLAGEPGLAQQYNGPAASQPVIRGLGGDRVLVLEDGLRLGDVSTTAADHAVTIEPLTAERIEVVRGPAGLLYGSNALGGVINVIRDEVPRTLPERLSGTVSLQGESVNRGATGGGSVLLPFGHVAIRAEVSGRTAGDTRTPLGPLPSTEMQGYSAGVGGSWIGADGFAGAALRDYALSYGVPGTFNGETIPGAHEDGVAVDLRRTVGRFEAAVLSGLGPFSSVQLEGHFVRFSQEELEAGGFAGTRFGQLLGSGNLMARHRHEAGQLRTEGAIGTTALWRDHAVAGINTGSRPARQLSLAGYLFEELGWGPFRLEAGARYDWTRITPRGTGTLPGVRTREFGAFSGSVAALYDLPAGLVVGLGASRAFRTPSIEELYSDGPHLAEYSFNVGKPELGAEFGFGTDLFLRVVQQRLHAEFSLFRNAISDFIYYEALLDPETGEPVMDPRQRRFPVFQARQNDSELRGAEGKLQWEVAPSIVIEGSASYVRGTRGGSGEPLPFIPPLGGSLNLRYDAPGFFLGGGWEGAAAQRRTAEFEQPTAGFGLWNATSGVRWSARGHLHTVTLQVRNLTDQVWRDHLSRIRTVAPQPGRNVQLLYRMSF
jgi:iron complex outermembrane recepter protein